MKLGVFTGLAGLDMVYYQNSIPIENKKSKTNKYESFIGGPAANAAITYAMLGGKALLITCIGNSDIGKIIKKELYEDYGVDIIDFANETEMLPCISSISINMTNGSRTIWSGQQSIEPSSEIDIKEQIDKAAFCLSDCNLPKLSVKVLEEAKKANKPIILDAGSWKDNFEFYLSVANDVIASADCKEPGSNDDFITTGSRYNIENIAVTNGENAIRWQCGGNSGSISPLKVKAKDTLGAGDIFHGAYCYYKFEKQRSFQEALKKASVVASSSVEYFGPRIGIKEFLKRNKD